MSADPLDELLDGPAFAEETPSERFVAAASSCLEILQRRFPRYAEFLGNRTGRNFHRPFSGLDDLDQLPAIFLPVLKSYQFPMPPDLPLAQTLTSSGTTGQPRRSVGPKAWICSCDLD
jgi:hypothetical protein